MSDLLGLKTILHHRISLAGKMGHMKSSQGKQIFEGCVKREVSLPDCCHAVGTFHRVTLVWGGILYQTVNVILLLYIRVVFLKGK